MELAGFGDSDTSYLTNSTKLFWLGSISRLSFFASWYSKLVKNGSDILKRSFGVDFSLASRKTKENAEKLWEKIGSPEKMRQANAIIKKLLGGGGEKRAVKREEYFGSDGVVAMDSEGNACAMIHTINSLMWGTGLFVQGNALPHSAAIFASYVKNTEPGTRLPCGLQPVLGLKVTTDDTEEEDRSNNPNGRRPVLAVSVVGQSHAMNTHQFVTNVLDSHMTPREALGAPTLLAS
jgi:gamma-glutamyltranspeptidase